MKPAAPSAISNHRTAITLACLAVALSGCASYRAAPLDVARSAARFDQRSLDDARLDQFITALGGRRTTDQGWDVDSLTLAALYFHPDMDLAYAKLATAEAGVRTARQRPNPSLTLTPSGSGPAGWTVGAAVSVLIETFGKRADRTAEAQAMTDAARHDLDNALWQVRSRVRQALVDVWIGQARVELAGRRLDQERELVTLLEHRAALGAASALDLSREGANRDQMTVALSDAQRALTTARTQLAGAVGVPAPALERTSLSFSGLDQDLPQRDLPRLRDQALSQRADLDAALAQYAAAEAALKLQVANQYPNLSLSPAYNDQGDHRVAVPATFDLPLFNQNQGPIAEAAGRRREAAARVQALQAQIAGAVDTAAAAQAGAAATLHAADALAAAQRARQARTAKLFEEGQVNRPALVAGQLEVLAGETSRLDALAAERLASGQLEDAVQQPLFGSRRSLTAPDPVEHARVEAGR